MDKGQREFSRRLIQAMQAAGYEARPVVLFKQFNTYYQGPSVSFQSASRWLRGMAYPEQDKIMVLARWLDVEPQWLRFGTGWRSEKSSPLVKGVREERAMYGDDRQLFEIFLELPEKQRAVIRETILAFAALVRQGRL